MYHPHADEMVQMAMGVMGMFIVHPKDPGNTRWTATSSSSSTLTTSTRAASRPGSTRCSISIFGAGTAESSRA